MAEVVLDASALLALLNGEPGADLVASALPQATISEALYERGGSSDVRGVLKVVEIKMRGVLKGIDLETLPSGSPIRWASTAMWARKDLIGMNLLKTPPLMVSGS